MCQRVMAKLFIDSYIRITLQHKPAIGKILVCGKSTHCICGSAKEPNTTFLFVNAIGDNHFGVLGDF